MRQLSTNILRVIISKNELFCIILLYSSDFCLNLRKKKTPKNKTTPLPWKILTGIYTQVPPADFSTTLSLWGTSNRIPGIHEWSLVSQCSRGQSEDQQGEISSRQPVTQYREYIYNCMSLIIFYSLNSCISIYTHTSKRKHLNAYPVRDTVRCISLTFMFHCLLLQLPENCVCVCVFPWKSLYVLRSVSYVLMCFGDLLIFSWHCLPPVGLPYLIGTPYHVALWLLDTTPGSTRHFSHLLDTLAYSVRITWQY